MIIDLILDRKDGVEYNTREFYYNVMRYGKIGDKITEALDYGQEDDIKRALCNYIVDNEYNLDIQNYINSVEWLQE